MLIILFSLNKFRQILKLLNLKWKTESELISIKSFLVKVTLKIGREKYSWLILFWKLILGLITFLIGFKQRKNDWKLLLKRIVAEYSKN